VFVLGALAVPALQLNTSDSANSLPAHTPVMVAQKAIEASFPGAPDNAELVVRGTDLGGARPRLTDLGRRAMKVTGGRGDVVVRVARDGEMALVSVPMPDRGEDRNDAVVSALRADVAPTADRVQPAATLLVTGYAAGDLDVTSRFNETTPIVIAFVLVLALVLLLATFRSLPLALGVLGLNLLSVGATYGILTAVFQHTWAERILDFTSNGTVTDWVPLNAFVILFGLSMDYTILVLERIREARADGRSPREAAAEGVAGTARTVTSAAVVMVAIFAIFPTLPLIEMKMLGIALAAGVLIDATIVRGVALPAVATASGRRSRCSGPPRSWARTPSAATSGCGAAAGRRANACSPSASRSSPAPGAARWRRRRPSCGAWSARCTTARSRISSRSA
jgi:uncharacterized membrane protein YdfJ with MMPL/SSD domain